MGGQWEMAKAPQTLCSHKVLVKFLDSMSLHLLNALRTISGDYKCLFFKLVLTCFNCFAAGGSA